MKHPLFSFLLVLPTALLHANNNPIALTTHSTIYQSDTSSASFLFDIKAKTSIVIYGLDVNLASTSSHSVQVYTKVGSYDRNNAAVDESAWDLVLNSTVTGNGVDNPATLLTEGWTPVIVPKGVKQSFLLSLDDGVLRSTTYNTGDRMYYINRDLIIYGKGAAKRKGWDGRVVDGYAVFNGGVKYVKGEEGVEVTAGNIVGLPTVAPTVVSFVPRVCMMVKA